MPFNTLKNIWIKSLSDILYSSRSSLVEDYYEIINYSVVFSFEDIFELTNDERICSDFDEMKKVFFTDKENIFGHSYANSIINPIQSIKDPVNSICEILKKNDSTRKAVLTFAPYGDEKVPCINDIQFLVRNNELNIIYNSRGQDMFRKFPCDAMCIADFGINVAKKNNYNLGKIYANISSAHIYEKNTVDAKKYIEGSYYGKNVIITGNEKKYEDYKEVLKHNNIDLIVTNVKIPEIQSIDSMEVTMAKAKFAYDLIGFPVWVDDMSLSLESYPLFPGPYTKSIFKQIGIDGLKLLIDGKCVNGTIICCLCRFDGKNYQFVKGENKGFFDFSKKVEDEKMPLNSIFTGEGFMAHRNKAINNLVKLLNGGNCDEI